MSRLERIRERYRMAAVMLLNTLLIFVLINMAIYPFLWLQQRGIGVVSKYGRERLMSVYPDRTETEIKALLEETWSRPYVYEPFTQFKERPFEGTYVNVDLNGIRRTIEQGPWPPDPDSFNIFVFGGSTAFGYGVSDDETIASYLQMALQSRTTDNLKVYNFARGHYYSTQERILFNQLVIAGNLPDLAVFIDGLNDFFFYRDEPAYTPKIHRFVEGKIKSPYRLSEVPLSRVLRGIRKYIQNSIKTREKTVYDDDSIVIPVVERYIANKKLIEAVAETLGIRTVFVWQPIPLFKYDASLNPFSEFDFGRHTYSMYGYQYLETLLGTDLPGPNFLWSADIQQESREALYVDLVHYSPGLSKQIALHISDFLVGRNLLGPGGS